jgi:hypothetical protein
MKLDTFSACIFAFSMIFFAASAQALPVNGSPVPAVAPAIAAATGPVDATEWKTLIATAVKSVRDYNDSYAKSLKQNGIGPLFGWLSAYAKMNDDDRKQYVREEKRPGTNPPEPVVTSCIIYTMKHLKNAYTASGHADRWAEIRKVVLAHDSDGLYLARELQKDGWEGVYWNPDTRVPADGKDEAPSTYRDAVKFQKYYGVTINHFMINYRPTEGSSTVLDPSGPLKLRKVPLWVGIANGAYHVFLGNGSSVAESHSPFEPTDKRNVMEYDFFANYMGFGSVMYLSGVIMIPPGTWD